MLMTTALATYLLLQCSVLCVAITVPVVWNEGESEVKNNAFIDEEFSVDVFKPTTHKQEPVPAEYFQYTAKKPQFAADIASFHGLPSPASHYKAYPVRPYTGENKPNLGKHRLQDQNKEIFTPLQKYTQNKDNYNSHINPIVSNYEVYHPYKAEEPALQEIYKDPVLDKIRNDLRDTSKRLQNYEKEAGRPEIEKGEYLESPEETDRKKVPHRNVPVKYEIHKPQRRPVYYIPLPRYPNRDQVLNHRFRHPWNQNFVKIRPAHYQPLKHHLQKLRQHHALTYDDEHNEYPQVPAAEEIEQPSDGYDIYDKGRQKYVQLRNNLDESINKAVRENRPLVSQNLELQPNEKPLIDEEDEFVPIKSYAQVRKTETTKHLPKSAAFEDADTLEEIKNAPRLKEAVKTTKAQTVYTEEGYEDSAYDHAGEQKHASDHEGHGGYLKENEISGGKYKIPSVSADHDDERRSAYRNQVLHGKKWNNSDKDDDEENKSEQYIEDEREQSAEENSFKDSPEYEDSQRNKRENESVENKSYHANDTDTEHDLGKREANFEVPDIDLNSTLLTEDEILEIAKEKKVLSEDDLRNKYPYYFKNLKHIHRDSPLRYAENLKLIPKKSKGGTEFYDSRSQIVCPEVDKKVDAIPKKLKKKGHPDSKDENSNNNDEDEKEDIVEQQPRLSGLGDKIDCFKAKYFGENPLDSPFFKEGIIPNPEPVTVPNIFSYKLKEFNKLSAQESNIANMTDALKKRNYDEIFNLINKLRNNEETLKESPKKENKSRVQYKSVPFYNSQNNGSIHQPSNILIELNSLTIPTINKSENKKNNTNENINDTIQYQSFTNVEDITQVPVRSKRAAPFIYEPYKIIRDGQVQESKKTTTTGNISPLIKQLQSSRVVDKVTNSEKEFLKTNTTSTRTYKDIGKNDRVQSKNSKGDTDTFTTKFIDVNIDKRRGEPRYELRTINHKPEYTPIENRKSISRQDYEAQTKNTDMKLSDIQSAAASNNIQRTIVTTPSSHHREEKTADEEYDYEEDENDETDLEIKTTSTTSTTTQKPIFRKKIRTTTSTETPPEEQEVTQVHKLRLATRFRTTPAPEKQIFTAEIKGKINNHDENDDIEPPKYKEKKKKTTKSTLVTDTQKYGEVDNLEGDIEDDMRKEEVDALIGIKHDMDDYIPLYEKEELRKNNENRQLASSEEEDEDDSESDESDEYDGDDEDEDEVDDDIKKDEEDNKKQIRLVSTTSEPTKRTLIRTTDIPASTTETSYSKIDDKPKISRKKIEIHKELPVNKSAPHVTQFKQDIKEVEIVKEIPRKATTKKPKKNLELLELYKDDNLAKNINKLKDVEVFKQNLDLTSGPRHGGNYRSAKLVELAEETSTVEPLHGGNLKIESKDNSEESGDDAETSQTEHKKLVEFESSPPRMHGGNLKSINNLRHSRRPTGKNAKLIELVDTTEHIPKARHGGNFKSTQGTKKRGNKESERLTELNDNDRDDDNDSISDSYGGSSGSYSGRKQGGRPMHGGNYRSEKIIQTTSIPSKKNTRSRGRSSKEAKKSAAVLLSSFVQAAPVLTTTPAYILDPSKRMYYYVDK